MSKDLDCAELIAYIVESNKRLLEAATGAPPSRMLLLVTPDTRDRLEAWDGIEWRGDSLKSYAARWIPGQVGEVCGLPVFVHEPLKAPAVVEVMQAGLPLNYGLVNPN